MEFGTGTKCIRDRGKTSHHRRIPPTPFGRMYQYRGTVVQHKKALSDLKVEISLAERRVKGLTSMVDNLRKAKAEKESQLLALEHTLQSHQGDTAAIIAERERLEKELASIQTKLEDKQDKLRTADQQLEALKGTWMPLASARRS